MSESAPLSRRIGMGLAYAGVLFDLVVLALALVYGQWGIAVYFVFLLAVMVASIRSVKSSFAIIDMERVRGHH